MRTFVMPLCRSLTGRRTKRLYSGCFQQQRLWWEPRPPVPEPRVAWYEDMRSRQQVFGTAACHGPLSQVFG